MPDFLDDIESAKKTFEKIEKDFRASLEDPEIKKAIEDAKKRAAAIRERPSEEKKPDKTREQALLTPEAGLLLGLAVVGIYIWMSRK